MCLLYYDNVYIQHHWRFTLEAKIRSKINVLKNGIYWLSYYPKVLLKCSSGIARQLTCTRLSALYWYQSLSQ